MHDEPFTLCNDQLKPKPPKQQQLTIWCETDSERPIKQAPRLEGQQGLFEAQTQR